VRICCRFGNLCEASLGVLEWKHECWLFDTRSLIPRVVFSDSQSGWITVGVHLLLGPDLPLHCVACDCCVRGCVQVTVTGELVCAFGRQC
jgi:hypothetical protein